jgi:predicted nucleic acid-binding protein
MSVEAFVDTNVLIYAASGAVEYPDKHKRAWEIIGEGNYAISAQVLAEFYVNAIKETKDRKPLPVSEAATWVENLSVLPVIPIDHHIVKLAVAYSQRFQISYWDAALIAASERLNIPMLYTEDLNHGQKYGAVTVINPFRAN